jgi:DNA repair exonuclease SbcCD ATPase subunit
MKILLKNFGIYENKEFELPNNSFVLFKGENGSGKSTVFKAISWVLFSKLKTVKHGTQACEVILQDQNWIVKRTSKPQTLKLKYGDDQYEGTAAQKLIYKLLGTTWEQFRLSTMIDSNTKSSLASITPGDRFSVIRELVSGLDEPQQDAEKIQLFEKSINSGEDVSKGELNILKKQLKDAESEFSNMDKPDKIDVDDSKREELEELLEKDRKKQENWVDILSNGLSKESAEERLASLNALPQIQDKLSQMKKLLQYSRHITSVEDTKEKFEKGKKEHFKSIKSELKKLKKEKFDEDLLKEQARELATRVNAKEDDNPYWDKDPIEIEGLVEESKEIVKAVALKETKQKCPCCSKYVAIGDDQKIVKWVSKWGKVKDTDDIHHLDCLKNLEHSLNEEANEKWEQSVKNRMKIKELERMLNGNILSPELVRLRKSFGEEIEKPEEWKDKYTIDYLEERIDELTRQIGSIPNEEDGEREKLKGLLSSKILPTKKKLKLLNKRIEQTEKELDEIRKCEKQIAKVTDWKRLKKTVKETKKIIRKTEDGMEESEKLKVAVQRLKVLQKEAEIISMQNVVDTLNVYSADYLQRFFDDSIDVSLVLIKKTQKGVKLSLELEISFHGEKYDISEFSQGELIKINLAFILSMNRLQGSRYLFLDEVLQNLDKNVLLEIYSCLKSVTDEVSVFVIDHNSVEGFFDHVIEFGNT